MKESGKEHTVLIEYGYPDKEKEGFSHNDIVFSKRPTGGDFMRAMEASDGDNPEYLYELMTTSITSFGELPMPVPMTVLLALNWVDQEVLQAGFFDFLGSVSAEKPAAVIEPGKVRLGFGVERGGVTYHIVQFGRMLTGYDQIAIRKNTATDIEKGVLTTGREILHLETLDGARSEEGLSLDELKSLDWEDLVMLEKGGKDWRDSFRK